VVLVELDKLLTSVPVLSGRGNGLYHTLFFSFLFALLRTVSGNESKWLLNAVVLVELDNLLSGLSVLPDRGDG
jgi:hypothetical protein